LFKILVAKKNFTNYIVFAAFDKPQTTITEESEGGKASGRAREEELTCLGDISYLYLS